MIVSIATNVACIYIYIYIYIWVLMWEGIGVYGCEGRRRDANLLCSVGWLVERSGGCVGSLTTS